MGKTQPRPAPAPADAEPQIQRVLEKAPALCTALARALGLDGAASPQALMPRLCGAAADHAGSLDAQYQAVMALKAAISPGSKASEALRLGARELLSWTAVLTVTEGHQSEAAERVRQAWRAGSPRFFRFPFGHRAAVEVLMARWRNGKAEFGTELPAGAHGRDDITPACFPEPGINLDNLGDTPEVDYIYCRLWQMHHGSRPDRRLTPDDKHKLREVLNSWHRLGGPQPRLVIDAADSDNPYASDQVLAAVQGELAEVYVIRIDSRLTEDPGVFVLPPARLTARIEMILQALQDG